MALALEENTPISGYPVTLEEAKDHLKVANTAEDPLIHGLIAAANDYAESITRRALMRRTFTYYLDAFPLGTIIEIPKPKLVSVESVKYYDASGVLQTFASSKYGVDTVSEPGRIRLGEGEVWPTLQLRKLNPVEIAFTAGYLNKMHVPFAVRQAMLLMIAHWFENRESVVVGPTGLRIKEVPQSANWLLDQHRVMTFY